MVNEEDRLAAPYAYDIHDARCSLSRRMTGRNSMRVFYPPDFVKGFRALCKPVRLQVGEWVYEYPKIEHFLFFKDFQPPAELHDLYLKISQKCKQKHDYC